MNRYVVLLRGINVGGKNKIPMAHLQQCLEAEGFGNVRTYIQSGNIVLESALTAKNVALGIESLLERNFTLDSKPIRALALSTDDLEAIVANKPLGFGERSDTYHSDVIFLMGVSMVEAMVVFAPREGVDKIWPGNGVVYSQRLTAERTKSRLGKIVGTVPYKSMTIRNWNTTTKLLALCKQ